MSIKNWPSGERPRERLLTLGPAHLSDAELLAIFLRTGLPGQSAVDLARELLGRFGGIRGLLAADEAAFVAAKGLGQAKYVQLQAVMELAARHLGEALATRDALRDPSHAQAYLQSRLRDRPHEIFAMLYLDNQHRVLAFEELTSGTIDSTTVYPREVVKAALRHNAAAVILAHNHPSGMPEPSAADRHLTRRLCEALALVDIRVLDHVVVGECCVSFAERGML